MPRPSLHRQRGAAALITVLALFFVMTLVAAFANRNHVFEQRASANQVHATQAFEAAEAGIEWAIAMLNSAQPIDDQCVATTGSDAKSFRERYLSPHNATGMQTPLTWVHDGQTAPLQAACVRSAAGWGCHCPSGGAASLAKPAGVAPAFSVHLAAAPQPGVVQVLATGCSSLGGECAAGADDTTDAVAHIQVTLGLVPGLVTPPAAPLTVKGTVVAGSAAIGLHNADASSGGASVHVGGSLFAPGARLTTAAGGSPALSTIEGDESLSAMTNERFFAAFFGIDKALWQQHPAVVRVSCSGDCATTLSQAIGSAPTHRMVWVDGDLPLDGPITLGTPQRPLIIVASGAMRFHGAVVVHGVLYAASLEWNNAAAGSALLRGAAIVEDGYQGNGEPDLVYDSGVLAALKTGSGSFARVPGSWKDF